MFRGRRGGLGGCWIGLGWVKASPGGAHPTVRAAFPVGLNWARHTRVSGRKGCRTADSPQTLVLSGDTAVPVCVLGRENHPLAGYRRVLLPLLSPVQEGSGKVVGSLGGGGGMVAHMLAPQLVVVRVVCAWCYRPAGRQGSLTLSPLGGVGSQPARHKDKLPNRSTTAYRRREGRWYTARLVLDPHSLTAIRHRWCCQVGWVRLPTAWGVLWAGGGAPGRTECCPALETASANCTGRGAAACVDQGAQRAPHSNGLSV